MTRPRRSVNSQGAMPRPVSGPSPRSSGSWFGPNAGRAVVAGIAVVVIGWMVIGGGWRAGERQAPTGPPATVASAPASGSGQSTVGASERSTPASSGEGSDDSARPDCPGIADWPVMDADRLPPEGLDTLDRIEDDGPFPYRQDGATFFNREGILPDHPTGYYREYTVPTPGEDDRGARRIVVGDCSEYFYTDDHYETFTLLVGAAVPDSPGADSPASG